MKAKISLLVILMLFIPAVSAEHSNMKTGDMGSSASSQTYMSDMNEMHEKVMAAVKEPGPGKAFAKGMIACHEGATVMARTELKYGKDPGMRELVEDIIKMQKGEIDQMNKWLDSQKQGLSILYTGCGFYTVSRVQGIC